MKRLFAVFIIVCISAAVFAGTSFMASGTPKVEGDQVGLEFAFTYDPDTMQRLSFGFTDKDEINWNDNADDYGNKYLYLKTGYVRDKITYGYGDINFYWKLKTTRNVVAQIYLEGPLHDPKTNVSLDWSLAFNSKENGRSSLVESKVDAYGIQNAKTIYTKVSDSSKNVQLGYVPIKIRTANSDADVVKVDQNYVGTVGVIVKTN